jgi:hypothetical protein
MPTVPNVGEALTLAAGFGGTVGLDVVGGDVGSWVVEPDVSAEPLVSGSVADDTAVGTVTVVIVGAAADEATD